MNGKNRVTSRIVLLALVGALVFPVLAGYGQEESKADESGKPSFDSFRLLIQRNVFDPNRRGPLRQPPVERKPDIDEISLVGTLVTDTGALAFFEGSSAEYRKVLKLGESIANYQLESIDSSQISMKSDTNAFTLKVGMRLTREDRGKWEIATGPSQRATRTDRKPASQTESSVEAQKEEQSSSGDDDILKRLMERRKQELK